MMRKDPDCTGLYHTVRLVQLNCGCVTVRLRKGQPVSGSNRIGIVIARPVFCMAADIANLEPRFFPKLMLDGQVILQGVRGPVAELLANRGIAQPSAKTGRGGVAAGGKRVGIVEEPSVIADRTEAGNKRRVHAGGAIRHEDVVTVVKLTEPCPDRPLPRSSGIPSHTQPGPEGAVIVVLDSPVGPGQSARSRRAGIREETRRIEQTIASSATEQRVKRRL